MAAAQHHVPREQARGVTGRGGGVGGGNHGRRRFDECLMTFTRVVSPEMVASEIDALHSSACVRVAGRVIHNGLSHAGFKSHVPLIPTLLACAQHNCGRGVVCIEAFCPCRDVR